MTSQLDYLIAYFMFNPNIGVLLADTPVKIIDVPGTLPGCDGLPALFDRHGINCDNIDEGGENHGEFILPFEQASEPVIAMLYEALHYAIDWKPGNPEQRHSGFIQE